VRDDVGAGPGPVGASIAQLSAPRNVVAAFVRTICRLPDEAPAWGSRPGYPGQLLFSRVPLFGRQGRRR